MKILSGIIHSCFKKVRIGGRKENPKLKDLFEKRKHLKSRMDKFSKDELKKVEAELAEMCAEDNFSKIKEEVKNYSMA